MDTQKVVFMNKELGLRLAGLLRLPEGFNLSKNYPAIVLTGPMLSVKEQAQSVYAEKVAEAGYVTLVFDGAYFCSACYYCRQSGGICAKKDDMADILQKMIDADVLVLASPVYFYSIDAQLKALIDRTLARWTEVKNKEFYYIVTCADDDTAAQETTLACFRGYADCVKGAKEKGIIYGTGVYQPGEIRNNPACSQAYDMGKSI